MAGDPPLKAIETVMTELEAFDSALATRTRWLVFNKADTLDKASATQICRSVCDELNWTGPWHLVSGVSGQGCAELCQSVWQALALDDD